MALSTAVSSNDIYDMADGLTAGEVLDVAHLTTESLGSTPGVAGAEANLHDARKAVIYRQDGAVAEMCLTTTGPGNEGDKHLPVTDITITADDLTASASDYPGWATGHIVDVWENLAGFFNTIRDWASAGKRPSDEVIRTILNGLVARGESVDVEWEDGCFLVQPLAAPEDDPRGYTMYIDPVETNYNKPPSTGYDPTPYIDTMYVNELHVELLVGDDCIHRGDIDNTTDMDSVRDKLTNLLERLVETEDDED